MPVARCRARCPLVFAMLAAWAAGCVVPVGPQFQDPLAVQNFAPRITYTEPPEGRPTISQSFTITVEDLNVGDPLFVRLITDRDSQRGPKWKDYPRGASGSPAPRTLPMMEVLCEDLAQNGAEDRLGQHQIIVVVADRAFANDDQDPEEVTDPGLWDTAYWTLNLSCPPTR